MLFQLEYTIWGSGVAKIKFHFDGVFGDFQSIMAGGAGFIVFFQARLEKVDFGMKVFFIPHLFQESLGRNILLGSGTVGCCGKWRLLGPNAIACKFAERSERVLKTIVGC